MRHAGLAVIALVATTGVALAQQDQKLVPAQDAQAVILTGTAEVTRDDVSQSKGVDGFHLKMASVADVDLNGDGYVSFDELMRFDITKDF